MRVSTRLGNLLAFLLCLGLIHSVFANPPSRVSRLSKIQGDVAFSPAGENQWYDAILNRPFVNFDSLAINSGGYAQLQLGQAIICLDENTKITVLNVDNNNAQFQLDNGLFIIKVWRIKNDQNYEIDTPNLAFSITEPGDYEISVTEDGSTTVTVREGRGGIYGENQAYEIVANQSYRFMGTDLDNAESLDIPESRMIEKWCHNLVTRPEKLISAKYVPVDVIGIGDLDEYGSWLNVADYGPVWYPKDVSADWAPYQDGQWLWEEPYGWTWVDNRPWGFAPFHYGRWANAENRWFWVPCSRDQEPIYSPALVAFIGGNGFNIGIELGLSSSISAVGWFPLGPGDIYIPSYAVSESYFMAINQSNALVSQANLRNVYRNPNAPQRFLNRRINGAI
nr:FecR family protein [Pseudomonadota bacterium]